MQTCPYRMLIGHKRWATNGLYEAIARNLARIPGLDRILLARILDHIQAVDEIFSGNLTGRDHGRSAPHSAELPSLERLAADSRSLGDWYAGYVRDLAPDCREEKLAFRYANGSAGCLTRGEMLLHVAVHGAYHRGNAGVLLHRNGIEPNPDRLTDFLESASPAAAPAASGSLEGAL